jgi:hypothetical protein
MTEINKLAHSIALEAAAAVLDSNTVTVEANGEKWHDVNTSIEGVPLGIQLKDELRYLTLRGALVWHSTLPNLVRVVEVWR